MSSIELQRLQASANREPDGNWKRWGPYLSERQWGTVREDYSPDGEPWDYFPFEHAHQRAYRWGEDGLLGITDRECRLCFALALWNGADPILKERLYGLTGPQGNHGEDVKECYYYLDSTPTHSYMKGLYKYPQSEFPYEQLRTENSQRDRTQPEFELADTGVFDENRYFDVSVEYAKNSPNDLLIRIEISNRGPVAATIHVLPTLWFRNTWTWSCTHEGCWPKPSIWMDSESSVVASHATLGKFLFHADIENDKDIRWLFTDNVSNLQKLYGSDNDLPHCKDAFHDYVIHGDTSAVSAKQIGTKATPYVVLNIESNTSHSIKLRLTAEDEANAASFGLAFDNLFKQRIADADDFYDERTPANLSNDERNVLRQSDAGLLWTKQFYHLVVDDWLQGDPEHPAPESRKAVRNHDWPNLHNRDVISMPDKWEYPWYAAWDLAFHMIPFGRLDLDFAKEQLVLFLREWYMHPNGQIPAYEWNFSDVNPPVHAWACWRVYQMTKEAGQPDRVFLSRVFQKLLVNFTWWVNRKDVRGKNIFAGGFLGLDNIGVFDRSKPLPTGGHLEQADGTAWMAFYCSNMLMMALELADGNPAYGDMASKFFEHYVAIAEAMNTMGGTGLWDEEDGFYYDHLHVDDQYIPLKIRSMVGIIPLFAATVLDNDVIERLPGFKKRMEWFLEHRSDLSEFMTYMDTDADGRNTGQRLLALPTRDRVRRIMKYVLDESEFLSPFGIRSLSKYHQENPFEFNLSGELHRVGYVPGESDSWMFGGNSNWRGPIWFPLNYLLIESGRRYYDFYGESIQIECPTGSGQILSLQQSTDEIQSRLTKLFLANENGARPCHAGDAHYKSDPNWQDLLLFHEYFHGDTGAGLGASHQTGWTGLVSTLLSKFA